MEVIMVLVVEVVPVLLLHNNNKNHRNSSTFQLRIWKQRGAPTNLRLSNPFKWRMCNRDKQVHHQDKQLISHRWPTESPTTSLCHLEDPRAAVRDADHPSNL